MKQLEAVRALDELGQAWLTLGPASKGSPSSRRFHTVSVVPLDSDGRRIGEDVATVHLRGRS